jgi:regulatory protein
VKPANEDQVKEAVNYALRLISIRLRTKGELELRLKRRGYPDKVVEEVLKRLEESSLLNEEEFAREFVRSKLGSLWHPTLIEKELRYRGIPKEIVERILQEIDLDELLERAKERAQSLSKRYRKLDARAKRRIFSYFMRRGFPWEVIREIMPK